MLDYISTSFRYLDDVHTTEKEKQSKDYLLGNANYWINTLVNERAYISTYRDYYNGIRDEKEFAYLTKRYGISTPTKLTFTPIIKPRIDALLGQLSSDSYSYTVAPVDTESVDIAIETKRLKKISDIEKAIDAFVETVKSGSEELQYNLKDDITKVHERFGDSFQSDFQIAAQHVMRYFDNSPSIDMRQKLKQLALDILVTGEGHYRVYVDKLGADPVLEIIKPENMFYNKNTNSQYLDNVDAVVHREYMTRKQILNKYGKYMGKDEIKELFGSKMQAMTGVAVRSGRTLEEDASTRTNRTTISSQMSHNMANSIAVYHVEWMAANKVPIYEDDYDLVENNEVKYGYRMDRYEITRIGTSIYVNGGRSKYISRSQDRPYEASLTYNSIFYNDRNGIPYSTVGALKEPQDLYDLTMFYRDSMVANSGVSGDRINIAAIPKVLGGNFMDRLLKFIDYKRAGYELIDPTEPGAQYFNHYGSYDNSLNGQAVISINNILSMIEQQANKIAGTTNQMLGDIAERDAVGNVRQGIKQSLIINLDLFNLIRDGVKRISSSLLNSAKVAYIKGKKLSYIAGNKSYTFNLITNDFCFTDYNIYVSYSMQDEQKLTILKQMAGELIDPRTGGITADVLVDAVMTDSPEEAKTIISRGIAKAKKDSGETEKAMSQVQQLQQQLKEMQAELKKAHNELEKAAASDANIETRKLDLKQKETDYKYKIQEKAIDEKSVSNADSNRVKEEMAALERTQLFLSTGPEKTPNKKVSE